MNITAKFWDRAAKNYDRQEVHYKQLHNRIVENAQSFLNASDQVLDYGCGTGTKTIELAGHVRAIQGIDISPKMIAAATRSAEERNIQNLDFTQATIFNKQLEQESFDAILAFGILHLMKNLPQVLQRINQLLKPGGWFISSTACMGRDDTILNWINHLLFIPSQIGILPTLQFLKISELQQAITHAGFEIVKTETIPFNSIDDANYVVGRFVAAQKVSGNARIIR